LATKVGVGFPHISKIESGKESPSEELLQRIASALGASADELLLVANRVPEELADVVREKELAPQFLRMWKEGAISDAQVEKLLRADGRKQ
jgi:transcriptional regulator with XRE-family HTH domain